MKKRIITLVAVLALVSLSALAMAAPKAGANAAKADEYQALTPEKRAAVQKIFEAHQDKLYELREKIWAKHAELQALSATGKAEKADIQNLIGDISKLRDAMHKERLAIGAEIEKETGIKSFGRGFHHRGRGFGGGCESGCPGGGYGKGFGPGMMGGGMMGPGGCPSGNCGN